MILLTKPVRIDNENQTTIFTPGDSSVMTVVGPGIKSQVGNTAPKAPKTKAKHGQDKDPEVSALDWSPWGDNDDWAQQLLDKLDLLGVAKQGLDINSSMHFGAGMVWIRETYEGGKIQKQVVEPPGWNIWRRMSNFDLAQVEIVDSLETFYICWVEFLLDENSHVASVRALDTPKCRFGKKDSTGRVTKMFYNVHPDLKREDAEPIPLYDPALPRKYNRFVLPIYYRTWGRVYYPEPIYYATLRAGWGDIAIAVAKFIKYVYENQATLKYHMKVPLSTLKAQYPNWESLDEKEQEDKLIEFKTMADDHLTKPENAGKVLMSVWDDKGDKEKCTFEIEPIKNFLDTSRELPNNVAANSEILFSMGVDPALVGMNMPGAGDLNGSGGSDKREGRKSKQGNLKAERTVSLQVLNLIAYLNEYPPDIYPAYLDTDTSQTMDENPTGKENVLQ